jgi:hypothetical protein
MGTPQRGCLVPEMRMLECGEIPKGTRVLCLPVSDNQAAEHEESATPLAVGTVQSYRSVSP